MNIRVWPRRVRSVLYVSGVATILAVALGAGAQPPAKGLTPAMIADFGGDKHVTRPSQDATMGFSQPTRVTAVLARGGQTVKSGELLVRGEDAEEDGRLRLQKIQASNDYSVQRAMRTTELAKLEYEKLKEAGKGGAANPQEIDRARLTWEGADIDVSIAKMQKEQEQVTVEMAQSRLDRLQVHAPFDGVVDVILADLGQSLSENDKVLRIVNIDPLYIDVPVPTEKVLQLKIKNGDPAWVLMQLPGEPKVHVAKVREVAPTADSASATVRVRIEVPNPARTIAGLAAWVRFEEPAGIWRDRVVQPAPAAADQPTDATRVGASK
jgi:RND family efflux transporter MFP subunit